MNHYSGNDIAAELGAAFRACSSCPL